MNDVAASDLKFPPWFTRLCVLASIVWFLALAYQITLGIWWTASTSVEIDHLEQELDSAKEDLKVLQLRYERLNRDYAVMLDRTNMTLQEERQRP